jgi:hypothetical protein
MRLSYRLLVCIKQYLAQLPILFGIALLLGTGVVATASVIDSKHNLSSSGPGSVKATSETQICVFCHTPHGGDQTAGAPLWSRPTNSITYTPYLTSTMDASQPPGQPGASSKVCLSCHDGTLAIGLVVNLNGNPKGQGGPIAMSGTGTGGVMPDQHDFVIPADKNDPTKTTTVTLSGTGETRNLGVDMSNDHPISFAYNTSLYNNDGELRNPPVVIGTKAIVSNRSFGVAPTFPLENSQIQCPTCHDPHLSTNSSPKFLRGLRLQKTAPLGGFYVPSSDIMCLACHDKDKAIGTWSNSAHANVNVASEVYSDVAASIREFPLSTTVWQASCLGCHDTHTVPGARRLLREGTDSPTTPKSGGNSAIEETCYQCHRSNDAFNILNKTSPPNTAPDIMSDFGLAIHMPIYAQPETHDIGGVFDDSSGASNGGIAAGTSGRCAPGDQCGKDFMESEALLGKALAGGNITQRHTECTDCHNPHRATKNRLFNANAATPDAAGTHKHNIASGDTIAHSNIASGSLRGSFGVEPVYPAIPNFVTINGIPTAFNVKRGDPGQSGASDVGQAYVTREYQVCLKCHSNYAYDIPDLLGYTGGTPPTTDGITNNSFYRYLNTAMEIQAPATHKGAPASTSDSGAYSPTYSANNYRSWHPVMDNTGRTVAIRGNASPNLWRAPWNGADIDCVSNPASCLTITPIVTAVGNQTMYCSDCHGTVNTIGNGVVPDNNGSAGAWTEDGKPWGSHGSSENFILKGSPDTANPTSVTSDTLCFRCHDATQYADASGAPTIALNSGFSAAGNDNAYNRPMNNLHQRHAFYTTQGGVPHATVSVWPVAANGKYRCTMCHTGTAHGWKNKGFLVNLNDVGPELNKADGADLFGGALGPGLPGIGEIAPGPVTLSTGQNVPAGTQVPATMAPVPTGYTNGPYYQGALLYIPSFKASGAWTKADCANSGCH